MRQENNHNFFQIIFDDKAVEQRVMGSQSKMVDVQEKNCSGGMEQIATILVTS